MLRYGLSLRLIATLATIGLFLLGGLQPLSNTMADLRFRLASREATGQIALVAIDAASLRRVDQPWPWSRSIHRSIVDRLRQAGAATIAFDVDFSSDGDKAGDTAFEAALHRAGGNVLLAALHQRFGPDESGLIARRPLERFRAAAREVSVNVEPDDDGMIRNFRTDATYQGQHMPTMPVGLSGSTARDPGSFMIDYGVGISGISRVSVADLLSDDEAAASLRDKHVIIGATAVEMRDFFHVPRYGFISGALLQALAAESLLQGRALRPVEPAVAILVCILLMVGALTCRRMNLSGFILLCSGLSLLAESGAVLLQRNAPYLIDTSPMHVELMALALVAVLVEIDIRRVKILVSRGNANRLRTILDRVITDNFAGIVVVDQDGTVRALSRAAASLFGVRDQADGLRAEDLLPDVLYRALRDTQARTTSNAWRSEPPREVELALSTRPHPVVIEYVTTVSSVPGAVLDSGAALPDQLAVCLTFQDVTERRRAEADIVRLAHFDSLTGLANRHAFLARVGEALERPRSAGGRLAVLLFDLDRFKLVNDRLGHSCGDALLRSVAQRLVSVVRKEDVVARLGGDEFALLIERDDAAAAKALAEALVEGICGTYDIEAYQVTVAISIGMALADTDKAATLLKRADAALYAAKAGGGARVKLYDAAMEERAEAGRLLEQDLRDAIGTNQFEVFYQRQVDVVSEAIIGVEALARWNHPRRGYVSPTEFIPVAERTGLVEEIGAWVLKTACAEAVCWPVPIKLSVNLSAVQLSRGDLVQTVASALSDSGLPAERLDLELTESLLMENAGFARGTLDRVREIGVGLALDDFGTGYSSLAYLKSFDIDKIKIDRSFVKDLPHDQSSIAIIRAVVSLAQSLRVRVNTEGVETLEQLELLKALGCDEVQGFLHGQPEPSAAIEASLMQDIRRRPTGVPLRLAG